MLVMALLVVRFHMELNVFPDRKSFLPEQKVRMFMYQLCKAIYHMHKNGIFHRDVKPENILVKVGRSRLL